MICEGTAPALSCIQKTQAETQEPHPQIGRKIHHGERIKWPWYINLPKWQANLPTNKQVTKRTFGCFSPLLVHVCFFFAWTPWKMRLLNFRYDFQNSPNVIFPPSFHPRLRFTGKSSLVESWPTSNHGKRKRNQSSGVASIHRRLRAVLISSKYTHPEN